MKFLKKMKFIFKKNTFNFFICINFWKKKIITLENFLSFNIVSYSRWRDAFPRWAIFNMSKFFPSFRNIIKLFSLLFIILKFFFTCYFKKKLFYILMTKIDLVQKLHFCNILGYYERKLVILPQINLHYFEYLKFYL